MFSILEMSGLHSIYVISAFLLKGAGERKKRWHFSLLPLTLFFKSLSLTCVCIHVCVMYASAYGGQQTALESLELPEPLATCCVLGAKHQLAQQFSTYELTPLGGQMALSRESSKTNRKMIFTLRCITVAKLQLCCSTFVVEVTTA